MLTFIYPDSFFLFIFYLWSFSFYILNELFLHWFQFLLHCHSLRILRQVFKILKRHHYCCDVVECLAEGGLLEDAVDAETADFVDGLGLVGAGLPDGVDGVQVGELLEHAVAAENDEVVVIANLEALYVGSWNYHARIAAVLGVLGFDIANCPGYGQSTWEHSMWTNYKLHLSLDIQVRNVISILVNPAPILFNPRSLFITLWLMIFRKQKHLFSPINRHDSSTISNICHIAHISHYQRYNSTRP
mmetsp:Transcript_5812/g.4400  ORF Transcript_5812/g.4400 Transcript_5812/m.4400 type:complete len:245 (-) Transcript_5812:343-1077(-)